MSGFVNYENKRVVVTGCSSGVGEAAARLLRNLGAEVHGLARHRPEGLELAAFTAMDLRDPVSIDAAVERLGGARIDALFHCAGLPTTCPPLDIFKVNYIGARRLTDRLLPQMPEGGAVVSVSSLAGMGWQRRTEVLRELVDLSSYEEAEAWAAAKLAAGEHPYVLSKEALIFWTLLAAASTIQRGVRMNCTVPGPITTPFLDQELKINPVAMIDTVTRPINRRSSPEEQAAPLVFLNSDAARFINGAAVPVDGGFSGAVACGVIDLAKAFGGGA